MAGYRVSYKVLRQQGEDMKAVAKLLDGYADKVAQISGKLGDDALLAEVRGNLQKLRGQLGESRTVLNASGELLIKTVESYGGAEKRQVKKVDGMRAHNRDFYKRPVVVASAGGAAAGGAASAASVRAAAPAAATTTTVNYTDNSINVTNAAPEPTAVSAQQAALTGAEAPGIGPDSSVSAAKAAETGSFANPGVAAGAGALSGAAAAGAVLGGLQAKKKRSAGPAAAPDAPVPAEEDDLDARLEQAILRVRELEQEGSEG